MNFSINIIDITNNNSGAVTITERLPYRLKTTTKNGGKEKGEQIIYNIKGSKLSKNKVVVATIKIEKNSANRAFFKKPSISSKHSIKLVLKSVEKSTVASSAVYRDGEYIVTYVFDIVYQGTSAINIQDNAIANLIYNDKPIPKRIKSYAGITNISFGKRLLKRNGGTQKIKIFGRSGVTAKVRMVDDNGVSILAPSKRTNAVERHNIQYGRGGTSDDFGVMKDKTGADVQSREILIPSSGVYSFDVNYPSVVSKATKVNGAVSGATKVVFDSLKGVKAGDRVILRSTLDETTGLTVNNVNPDGDNINELTLSSSVTWADNISIIFKRTRSYKFHITTDDGLASHIPRTQPTYTINQYRNPILTIKLSTLRSVYAITHFNDVATSLSAGVAHTSSFAGLPCVVSADLDSTRHPTVKKRISFKYKLDLTGSHTFTNFGTGVNDSTIPTTNDWTRTTGDTSEISIHSITGVLGGSPSGNTIDISGIIDIHKWGKEDVTMELPLDNHIKDST
tara:strand:- start:12454 stop:13980 length:1527 start_codon:yes stop_codon:yes gene_type:complete